MSGTSTGSANSSAIASLIASSSTRGPFAYRRQDGVAVVPLALLGP